MEIATLAGKFCQNHQFTEIRLQVVPRKYFPAYDIYLTNICF